MAESIYQRIDMNPWLEQQNAVKTNLGYFNKNTGEQLTSDSALENPTVQLNSPYEATPEKLGGDRTKGNLKRSTPASPPSPPSPPPSQPPSGGGEGGRGGKQGKKKEEGGSPQQPPSGQEGSP